MPSLEKDHPLKHVADLLENTRDKLNLFIKNVIQKLESDLKPLFAFIKKVRAGIKEIAGKVGKGVVKALLTAVDKLLSIFAKLRKLANDTLSLAQKTIKMIMNAADPSKILKTVKALVTRCVRMLREIFSYVSNLIAVIDPIGTALRTIETFKTVLRFVISWISEVSGANSAVKKAKGLLKKAMRTIKEAMKDATVMIKELNTLKLPA